MSGLGSVGVGTGDTLEPLRRGPKATCSYFPVSSGSQNSPIGVTLYPCAHVPPCTRDTLVAVFDLVLVNTATCVLNCDSVLWLQLRGPSHFWALTDSREPCRHM